MLNLDIRHRERRPLHFSLGVIEADQQSLAAPGQDLRQMPGIGLTHFSRQGNDRRAVIQPRTLSHVCRTQGKEVATPEAHRASLVHLEAALLPDLWRDPLLTEKLLHGRLRQLYTQNLETTGRQPVQIQAFTAQRHQHPGAPGQFKPGPQPLQVGIDLLLMETDLITMPAVVPKFGLHDSPLNSINKH